MLEASPEFAHPTQNKPDGANSREQPQDKVAACSGRGEAETPQQHYRMGNSQYQQQDFVGARRSYDRAIALDPNYGEAFYGLGLVLKIQGQLEAATQSYREAIRCFDPTHPDRLYAYNNLGYLLVAQEKFDEALAVYQAARAIDPNFAPLYSNLGKLWLARGEVERAISAYRRALELAPDKFLSHYNLGKVWQRQQRHAEAVACFQTALELDGNHTQALCDCAVSLMEEGKVPEALAYLHRVISRQPQWVEAYCQRMAQLVPEDDLDRARFASGKLLQALTQQPDGPEVVPHLVQTYTSLGHVQLTLGRYDDAAQYYRKALNLDPQNPELHQQLQACATGQQRLEALARGPSQTHLHRSFGVYCSTQDWVLAANLDDRHYLPVQFEAHGKSAKGLPAIRQKKPEPPNPTYPQCWGVDCAKCLNRISGQGQLTSAGNGIQYYASGNPLREVTSETFVATVPEGRAWVMPQENWWRLCEAIAIITPDGNLLADVSRDSPAQLPGCECYDPRQHQIFRLDALPPLERVDGTIAVLAGLSGNVYFHWMVDVLPRLEILRRSGLDWDQIDGFVVNQCRQPFQRESLQRLGVPLHKIIESDRHPHIQAHRLVVPSFTAEVGWLPPWALAFLRRMFLPKTPPTQSRERIYISRAKARYRRLFNEAEVVAMLQEFGFVSVTLEELSLDEQIHLFAGAKAIVAPHGSGLTNLIFCQPETQVIELISPNYLRHYFGAISQQVGLKHYYVNGEPLNCYPLRQLMYLNPLAEDLHVNPQMLSQVLEKIGIVKSSISPSSVPLVVSPMQASIKFENKASQSLEQAEVFVGKGEFKAAIEACNEALNLDPQCAPACKTLGNIMRAKGEVEVAREWYNRAIELDPKYAEAYANLGNVCAQQNQWKAAVLYYQKAIALKPEFAGVYRHLSIVWKKLGQAVEAADCLYRAYEFEPKGVGFKEYLTLGNALLEAGQMTQAIACYRRALELNPNFFGTYQNLAQAFARQGKSKEAFQFYRRGKQLYEQQQGISTPTPTPSRVLFEEMGGQVKAEKANGNGAMASTRLTQTSAECLQRAETLVSQNQLEGAMAAAGEALDLDPKCAPACKLLGNIARSQGKLEAARNYYDRAIEIDPNYAEAHANIGNMCAQENQWPEAVRCYQRAIALKPDFAGAYHHLSKVLKKLGKAGEAAQYLYRAWELEPDGVTLEQYLNLGNTLFREGDLHRAIACYRQVLVLNPNFFGAYQNLAEALTRQGKSDEAASYYRQAMQRYMGETQAGKTASETPAVLRPKAKSNGYQPPQVVKPEEIEALWQKARSAYEVKEWQQAIEFCQQVLSVRGEDAEVHILLGNALYARGELEAAQNAYLNALDCQPELAHVQANLGSIYTQLEEPDQAMACYREAVRLDPNQPQVYVNWGRLYLEIDGLAEAIDCYRKAIALDRNSVKAYFGLGEAFKQQENWEEAAAAYRQVLQLEPGLSVVHEKLGDVLRLQMQVYATAAQASYREGIQQNPDNLELYHKALEIEPNSVELYLQLGNALTRQQKFDRAIAFYQMARRLDPDEIELYLQLGKVLATKEQWDDAVSCYQKAIELDPNCSWAYHYLGAVWVQQGQPEKAREALKRAIEIQPSFYQELPKALETVEICLQIGQTLVKQGQVESAIACYQRALELDSGSCWAHHFLGEAWLQGQQSERAIASFQRAIELDSNFYWSYQGLGQVLLWSDRVDEAIAAYRQALEIKSDLAESYKGLGDALAKQGKVNEASLAYRQALKFNRKLF